MAGDTTTDAGALTAHITDRARQQAKIEFGKRLQRAIAKKAWRQSDLARHSGVGKDSISNYVQGRTVPTRDNIDRMALALGVAPNDLWPNYANEVTVLNIQKMERDPSNVDFAFVHINMRVRYGTAVKLMKLLDDEISDVANAR